MHPGNRRRGLRAITKIGFSYLSASVGISLVITIWAIYLESFFHNASYVGYLISFFTFLGVLSYLILIPLVERKSKTGLLTITLLLFALSYFILSIYSNIYLVIILGILLAFLGSLKITTFGLIVRDKTKGGEVSKNEGVIYSLMNLSWLIGPLIAGYLSKVYGFKLVFAFGAFFVLISILLINFFGIRDCRKTKKVDSNIPRIVLRFFSSKERVFSYIISAAVTFWWALIYIYIPLTIIDRGYSAVLVGIFLSVVMVPLVSLEYFFGKIGGRAGFKKLFFAGFVILGTVSLVCFFISNIYLLIVLMVLASVGMSMIESTSEAYFFDVINKEQRDRYYGVYNTAVETGYFFGTFSAAIILTFLSFNYLFLFFGFFMFVFSLISLKIKDRYEFRRA